MAFEYRTERNKLVGCDGKKRPLSKQKYWWCFWTLAYLWWVYLCE